MLSLQAVWVWPGGDPGGRQNYMTPHCRQGSSYVKGFDDPSYPPEDEVSGNDEKELVHLAMRIELLALRRSNATKMHPILDRTSLLFYTILSLHDTRATDRMQAFNLQSLQTVRVTSSSSAASRARTGVELRPGASGRTRGRAPAGRWSRWRQ